MPVAVAIPAYNEAEGIGSFLIEIDEALAAHGDVVFVVADDCSTDDTREVLEVVTSTCARLHLDDRMVAPDLRDRLAVVARRR